MKSRSYPRSFPRAIVHGTAVVRIRGFKGEGQVLDVTVPGCSIDSPLSPKKGDSVTLRVSLLHAGASFHVALGIVRWVQGSRFGVEFIEMEPSERERYHAAVATCLHRQAASPGRPEERPSPTWQKQLVVQ